MRRDITYTWHLAELMARAGMHNSTDLLPHLNERGISLSSSQVYRLVTGRPERVSLQLMAAVCDIFTCGMDDLVTFTAADARRRKTATGGADTAAGVGGAAGGTVANLHTGRRPPRARVAPHDE
jgi:DNA-binding Xre family transcriptional regulator